MLYAVLLIVVVLDTARSNNLRALLEIFLNKLCLLAEACAIEEICFRLSVASETAVYGE